MESSGAAKADVVNFGKPGAGVAMTYREKLNTLRQQKGWSVATLARAAGLKVGTVNGYLIDGENNRLPNVKNAFKLAAALGVSMEEFADCSDWSNGDTHSTSGK